MSTSPISSPSPATPASTKLSPSTEHWRRHAILLLLSQGISLLGSSTVQFALVWHITLSSRSGSAVALAVLFAFLPMAILSPVAGVWADWYNRRLLVVGSDATVAMATVVILVCFLNGFHPLWLMVVVLAIRGAGGAVQSPAMMSLIPGFVPEQQLTRINGMVGAMQSLANIVAPALGGVVLAVWPIHAVFLIDIVTAIIGISVFWWGVRVPAYSAVAGNTAHVTDSDMDSAAGSSISDRRSWTADFRDGMRYVRRHEFFGVLIGLFSVTLFFASTAFLANLHIVRVFDAGTKDLSLVETMYGAGALAGGVFISVVKGFRRELTTIGVGIALFGVMGVCLGLAPTFLLFTAAMCLVGFILPCFNTPAVSLLQRTCDTRHLGKVMSLIMLLNAAILPLGMVLWGPLADAISTGVIIVVAGIVECAMGLVILWHPRLRAVAGAPKEHS